MCSDYDRYELLFQDICHFLFLFLHRVCRRKKIVLAKAIHNITLFLANSSHPNSPNPRDGTSIKPCGTTQDACYQKPENRRYGFCRLLLHWLISQSIRNPSFRPVFETVQSPPALPLPPTPPKTTTYTEAHPQVERVKKVQLECFIPWKQFYVRVTSSLIASLGLPPRNHLRRPKRNLSRCRNLRLFKVWLWSTWSLKVDLKGVAWFSVLSFKAAHNLQHYRQAGCGASD